MTSGGRGRVWLWVGLVSALALAGFDAPGKIVRIDIADLAFAPAEVRARVGDAIEWVNRDLFDHTATAPGMSWDVAIAAGESQSLTLERAGVVDYVCRYHPDMKGRIVVAPR